MNIFDNPLVNNKAFTYVGNKVYNFILNGGWLSCLIFAFLGIAMAIIGYYGKHGFSWISFLLFELPLYIFCIWALYQGVYKPIKKYPKYFTLKK